MSRTTVRAGADLERAARERPTAPAAERITPDERRDVDFDVVVVGGGAAGIGAAVSAADAGATVCLIEQYGFLGGAATASSVLTHCGFFDQTRTQVVGGVGQQVLDRLEARDLYQTETFPATGNTVVLLDLETTKSVYDDLVTDAGVTLLLHSRVIAASVAGGRVTDVTIDHRGGRETVTGRSFVDCSGDGVLLVAAGAGVQVSDVAARQASTLVMRVGGVAEDADLSAGALSTAVLAYRERSGAQLPRESGVAVRMPLSREVMLLLADQHRDVLDVHELTAAETTARRLSWQYLHAFQQGLAGWQDSYLAATGPQIGIRESRRLAGVETVVADDVTTGRRRPEDGVARCGWPMEDHATPGLTVYGGIRDKGWYDIPYGALCSADTDNLWAGGRLVSSDPRAYSSLRVMGTSFATGQACGAAAVVHADLDRHDTAAVRELLTKQGALL
ncbi:FAD-dependent oxidoreductase [Modestobacter sp. VKM Ac-2983]|uniref:FAD-dependent oxidoreductase n=1 Tax=Modestobacter sp. VKM Ac-2983 TaxID=3004137 RepID=UPI0022AB8DA6|nr:FAD-dependent oxidoreductase [Modestobacter sp. VKM Ac-2983]MCZ2804914.1 FAD-dependent oxidoreductase [Modestobacter sp. VKM Ac-2983]